MNFAGHYVAMMTGTPNPGAYVQAKKDGDIVGMIDAATGGGVTNAMGALNALGSTLISQETEDSVAAAAGLATGEAGVNIALTFFGGPITGGLEARVGAKLAALRLSCVADVDGLRACAAGMESRGLSAEVMARTLSGARRSLGVDYKALTGQIDSSLPALPVLRTPICLICGGQAPALHRMRRQRYNAFTVTRRL